MVKLMQHVEKRFPEEQELNAQFLELVNYIYRLELRKFLFLSRELDGRGYI